MPTIAPHPRLNNVENSAYFKEVCQDNFEVLAADTAKREPTYQNGTPTTVIGPPTSGTRVLNEFWRDALGGEFRCAVAGTPGTWMQIRPAAVTADPASGTIPTGYLVWNVTDGAVKRHAAGYSWEIAVGASTAAKVGFHGAAPTTQRANANQAAVTYASQTISNPPTQAQVQALNDGLVAVVALLNEVRAALVEKGFVKGGVEQHCNQEQTGSPEWVTPDYGRRRSKWTNCAASEFQRFRVQGLTPFRPTCHPSASSGSSRGKVIGRMRLIRGDARLG